MLIEAEPSLYLKVKLGAAVCLGLLAQACAGEAIPTVSPLNCSFHPKAVLDVSVTVKEGDLVDIKNVTKFKITNGNLEIIEPVGTVDRISSNGDNSLEIENRASRNQIYVVTLSAEKTTLNFKGHCGNTN